MIHSGPTGYEDEPRELFEELPAELHSYLYHHERLNQDLASEISYYQKQLGDRCKKILELGCGTCLLSANLKQRGYDPTGIDIELTMLKNAEPLCHGSLVQMDMGTLAFRPCFEAVVITQNTLNLLVDPAVIGRCLNEIREVLIPPGLIMAHLYCSEEKQVDHRKRRLQFAMFDHPQGGTIIRESIRSYDTGLNAVTLEQRYKIRRFNKAFADANYRTSSVLAALSRKRWIEIFAEAGFELESTCSDFSGAARSDGPTLHLTASLR